MCPCSCLYGVPLVYARGRTYIDGALCDCMVYRMFVWCTVYVLSWSYSHRWLFIMFVCCTVSVRTHRTYIAGLYCDCVVYRMSGWCTVYVLSCTHFDRSYHVCTVYRLCTHAVVLTLMDFSRVCMVYRVCVVSLSCLYGVPLMFFFFSSFLYLSAVTFSCNY